LQKLKSSTPRINEKPIRRVVSNIVRKKAPKADLRKAENHGAKRRLAPTARNCPRRRRKTS
jgi:hypothetical protein